VLGRSATGKKLPDGGPGTSETCTSLIFQNWCTVAYRKKKIVFLFLQNAEYNYMWTVSE
jgi:hypothetical protein